MAAHPDPTRRLRSLPQLRAGRPRSEIRDAENELGADTDPDVEIPGWVPTWPSDTGDALLRSADRWEIDPDGSPTYRPGRGGGAHRHPRNSARRGGNRSDLAPAGRPTSHSPALDEHEPSRAHDAEDTDDADDTDDAHDTDDADSGTGDPFAPPSRSRWHGPRWTRLRDRWVPEPLQGVRVDPGRRGSVVLSVVAAAGAVVAAIGVWSADPATSPVPPQPVANLISVTTSPSAPDISISAAPAEPTTIVVAVTGAVRQPGVVTLPAGSRVADAIAAAGGISDGVDYTGLNLAAKLSDGDSVVVGGGGQGVASAPSAASGASGGSGADASSLVDLNTADQAALETLPGVGPVMATNILDWRQTNGPFTSVDQLREITGIGPARFATLAPLVTV